MLVLFDIDATLLRTQRAGVDAMGAAGRSLVDPEFDENRIEYAGRLDPLIIADLLQTHGREASSQAIDAFAAAYQRELRSLLDADPQRAEPCPGVPELLDELERLQGVTLGLLTGNFEATGSIKLRSAGLNPERFAVRVWGDDSPHEPPSRDHLPGVAIERQSARTGGAWSGERSLIIGDTVHDIACALAHGCRSLGVATGSYSVDALAESGADRAVDDLSDTSSIVEWILDPEPV